MVLSKTWLKNNEVYLTIKYKTILNQRKFFKENHISAINLLSISLYRGFYELPKLFCRR